MPKNCGIGDDNNGLAGTALSPTELTKSGSSGSSTATPTNFEASCAFDKLAGAEALTYSQFQYTLVPTGRPFSTA